jgi:hypothetical protein
MSPHDRVPSRLITSRHVWHITSHRISSHHITSHHNTSQHITAHHITAHITAHHTTEQHIIPYHSTSHQIAPHHATSLACEWRRREKMLMVAIDSTFAGKYADGCNRAFSEHFNGCDLVVLNTMLF